MDATLETIRTGTVLATIGLAIVFVVLALLAVAVATMARLDARWQAVEEAARAAASMARPTIDDTTLLLVSAAVATWLGGRHRIRRVRLLPRDAPTSPWSHQGRLVLLGTHVVRNRSPRGD